MYTTGKIIGFIVGNLPVIAVVAAIAVFIVLKVRQKHREERIMKIRREIIERGEL